MCLLQGLPCHGIPHGKVCNFDLYRPIRVVHTDPPCYRYADRPLPGGSVKNRPSTVDFGRRRSIEREIDRRRSIEEEKGKEKRKRKKKKRGRKNTSPARRPRPPVVVARGRFFSRARRRSISPSGETDRGDVPLPRHHRFASATTAACVRCRGLTIVASHCCRYRFVVT
ncbi:hypothetical protein GW17_00018771 [Ensete ventricosum]|nr:hypothetical protein GW17_00018771 [Ensete ventricosum]